MANYTRNWLKEQIKGYLKDSSVDAYLDTWIDISAKRVSSILECFEMEEAIGNTLQVQIQEGVDGGSAGSSNVVVIDGGDAYNQDPASAPKEYIDFYGTFKRLVAVQAWDNGIWRNLRMVPKHEASAYKHTGVPTVYHVEQRRIYPLPFLAGDYRALFLREVEIPIGDNEDDVLTAYPYIFLNAALSEAYDWKQDENMIARYEQKWQGEAEAVRTVYRSEHTGETPAMRAI
jgi:hypothetical protein